MPKPPYRSDQLQMTTMLQNHMALYGYQPLDTPIIENAELFLAKAGDQIAERLFTFDRNGQILALRPEFTASAAHLYVQQKRHDVVRWQFSGPVFSDAPGTTQDYQFENIGAELIGTSGPNADAEMISMAAQGMIDLGIEDWYLVIGHVGLTRHLLEQFGLDARTQRFLLSRRGQLHQETGYDAIRAELEHNLAIGTSTPIADTLTASDTVPIVDNLLDRDPRGGTMGGRSRQDIARRLLSKHQRSTQIAQINGALDFLYAWMRIQHTPQQAFDEMRNLLNDDDVAEHMTTDWEHTIQLLEAYGISADRVVLQPDLARDWDYYTGIVFEVRTSQDERLAGGGRYNELTRLVGGKDAVPAVGFAYFMDIVESYRPDSVTVKPSFIVLNAKPGAEIDAAQWATMLRRQGISTIMMTTNEAPSSRKMTIHPDGTAQFGQQIYSKDQIDFLMVTLSGLISR